MRIGPLALTPSIALTDVGIDSNVFNTWDNPQSDFTMTLKPQGDAWFRMGRARFTTHASLGLVYFHQFHQERSANTDDSVRLDLPFTHVRPWASLSYLSTRDRPGFEIDARARRTETRPAIGVDLPLAAKTTFTVAVRRNRIRYASDAVFLGTYLRETFDRRVDSVTASLRYRLTPLTTAVVYVDRERQRFTFSPGRDSNSVEVMPGLEFGTFALLSGRAHVGYRTMNMIAAEIPDYRGVVADVDLAYTLLGMTRFAVQAERDIQYSFEIQQPYYVLTGVSGSLSQHLFGSWDIVARGGRQRLAYQQVAAFAQSTAGRTDTVNSYGAGIGYRLGRDVRLGFDVNQYRRHSVYSQRDYKALRIGTSVTYGF